MPNKNTKIEIRISEEEKQKLQEILKPKKLSISAFLRNYIHNFIKGEKENGAKE